MNQQEMINILKQAYENKLPYTISNKEDNSSPTIDAENVKWLFEEGYLKAIDASSLDGAEYKNPEITTAGIEFLKKEGEI